MVAPPFVTPHDTAAARKLRGAFFTPEPLAKYVTAWAVRHVSDQVLEPSCGEAAFLLAAAERVSALRLVEPDTTPAPLVGIELHEASAAHARAAVRAVGAVAEIEVGDFFAFEPTGSYDAVVGNPPYVRYQHFADDARARSRAAALRAGVALTNLASSWAAFTVHATLFLKRGGRLGLVLPAELLSVNYAAEVRRFLMNRFATVDLVLFDERVFPSVSEEVVLLLADGYDEGPTDQCRIHQVQNVEALRSPRVPRVWRPALAEAKWTPSLLAADAVGPYAALSGSGGFASLHEWGDTTLGMVTGNNRYFALSPARVAQLGLPPHELIPLSPPGSRHLRMLSFTDSARRELGAQGRSTWLFRPASDPSPAARAYIAAGEKLDVHDAYKCRARSPWWRVPLVRPADLLLTYMNADTPRLSTNRAGAYHLNSVHGVYLDARYRRLGMDLLPLGALTSMTLLGAELVGRAYGGGMLKLEPREADRLPVPSPDLVAAAAPRLRLLRTNVSRRLRNKDLLGAAQLVDDVLLRGELGMAAAEIRALRDGHGELRARRVARGATPLGSRDAS